MLTCCCLFRTFRNRAGSEAVSGSGSIRSEANFKHRHVFVFLFVFDGLTHPASRLVCDAADFFVGMEKRKSCRCTPAYGLLHHRQRYNNSILVRETSKFIGNHSTHERESRVKTCKDNIHRNPKESVSL